MLLQQQAMMAHAGLMGDKKQREVYVGNLAVSPCDTCRLALALALARSPFVTPCHLSAAWCGQ